MQTRPLTRVPGMALAVLLTLLTLQVPGFGYDARAREHILAGTWRLELTARNCQTGDPVGTPANQALHTYLPGGVLMGSTNVTALRSPSYGIWKPTGKRRFLSTFTSFRFHADGTPAGKIDVTETIHLEEDAHHFSATAVVEILNLNDQVIATICVDETAQRLTFDE